MPTTRKKTVTVEKKPAAKVARAPAKAAAGGAAKAPARAVAKAPAPTAKTAPPRATATKAPARAAAEKVTPKAAPKAAAPRKPKAPAWEPRRVPLHELDGKAGDPRLAAALAARERWHGRSGRPALKSATQAVAFARERMLVHPRVRSALPNLIDPIVGRSCSDEERVEGLISQTLDGWSAELAAAPDLLEVRLCFERPTLLSSELWPALVAVAAPREEAARQPGALSDEAAEALELLDRKGVVPADRLRQLLGLAPKEFERVHGELESRLLVLSRGDLDEDDKPITVVETLGRWANRVGARKADLEPGRAWTFLFIAALRSAVVLWPEEIDALFPWTTGERMAALQEAATTGKLIHYTEADSTAWVASPVPR